VWSRRAATATVQVEDDRVLRAGGIDEHRHCLLRAQRGRPFRPVDGVAAAPQLALVLERELQPSAVPQEPDGRDRSPRAMAGGKECVEEAAAGRQQERAPDHARGAESDEERMIRRKRRATELTGKAEEGVRDPEAGAHARHDRADQGPVVGADDPPERRRGRGAVHTAILRGR